MTSHSQPPSVENRSRIDVFIRPFQEFVKVESSAGLVLLFCTAIALAWANSPWAESYFSLVHLDATLSVGGFVLSKSLLHWINDGLMVIFFFLVGLEIKRELLVGELASLRQAMLPIAAAVGGMVVPALLYTAWNSGSAGAPGWGIPMATDIAFAIGVLALLGNRVPFGLKVFLMALAIVDDLGAVLVIAFFYTADISTAYLLWAGGFFLILLLANWWHVRHPLVYVLLGVGLWFCFLKSGVHATIAGVLLAMTIPLRSRTPTREFWEKSQAILEEFTATRSEQQPVLTEDQLATIHALERESERVQTPLQRMEHGLHPWVSFFIMPVFALANAGVALGGETSSALSSPVALGIIAGLVLGKQLGITFFSWLATKFKMAVLPVGVSWRHVYGAGWLGGIGFTMSLFVASLAFGESALLDVSKVGILTASVIAGAGGWLILRKSSSSG